jgi:hypothetical protein
LPDGWQTAEQLRQRRELVVREPAAEQRADASSVRRGRRLQLLEAGVGEDGIAHARVRGAFRLAHVARSLEPVEQPGGARGGEQEPRGDVDAPQTPLVGTSEVEEDLLVVRRQAVGGDEIAVQRSRQRGVCPEECD